MFGNYYSKSSPAPTPLTRCYSPSKRHANNSSSTNNNTGNTHYNNQSPKQSTASKLSPLSSPSLSPSSSIPLEHQLYQLKTLIYSRIDLLNNFQSENSNLRYLLNLLKSYDKTTGEQGGLSLSYPEFQHFLLNLNCIPHANGYNGQHLMEEFFSYLTSSFASSSMNHNHLHRNNNAGEERLSIKEFAYTIFNSGPIPFFKSKEQIDGFIALRLQLMNVCGVYGPLDFYWAISNLYGMDSQGFISLQDCLRGIEDFLSRYRSAAVGGKGGGVTRNQLVTLLTSFDGEKNGKIHLPSFLTAFQVNLPRSLPSSLDIYTFLPSSFSSSSAFFRLPFLWIVKNY